MTPADVIGEARRLLQDQLAPYRYSDDDLVGFVNQTLRRMAILRPDLFGVIAEIPVSAESVIQSLPSDALRLIDVFQVKDGVAVTEVDRETLTRSNPYWMAEPAGEPLNFMRHVKNPDRFFLYPRPATDTILVVEYAQSPPAYDFADTIESPAEAFLPVIVDGVVFLAESIDNEYATSGRAKLFLEAFSQSLTMSLQSRVVTDTKAAGLQRRGTSRRGVTVEGEVY
jgi:hypothetical protein